MALATERPDEQPVPSLHDAALAGLVTLAALSSAYLTSLDQGEPHLTPIGVLVLAASSLPVAWRRQAPLAMWLACSLPALVYGVADWPDPLAPFGPMVALATVFERCGRRPRWGAWTASALAASVGTWAARDSGPLDWWTAALALALAPVAGAYLATRRRLDAELRLRAERARSERGQAVRDARAAERARVARELHDVLAHHVTLLIVQAEAAASVPTMTDTERRETFDELAVVGRAAVTELRHLVGALRHDGEVAPTGPQPGLALLPDLLDSARQSGVTVDLTISGQTGPLPALIDLAAYRVIQEGVTNVLRHGAEGPVSLTVARRPGGITIELDNQRRPGPSPDADGGHTRDADGLGLVGLSERVALLGGTLEAGPVPTSPHRFRIRAWLPTDETR